MLINVYYINSIAHQTVMPVPHGKDKSSCIAFTLQSIGVGACSVSAHTDPWAGSGLGVSAVVWVSRLPHGHLMAATTGQDECHLSLLTTLNTHHKQLLKTKCLVKTVVKNTTSTLSTEK